MTVIRFLKISRILLVTDLHCDMKTVVVGRGKQRQNFTTEIVHWGLDTEGFILKHGVVKEESIFVSLTVSEELQKVQQDRMLFKNHVF